MAVNLLFVIILVVVILVVVALLFSSGKSSLEGTAGPSTDDITDAEILQFAQRGQKIQAIKLYRTLYGAGLVEAKEAVEALLQEAPETLDVEEVMEAQSEGSED